MSVTSKRGARAAAVRAARVVTAPVVKSGTKKVTVRVEGDRTGPAPTAAGSWTGVAIYYKTTGEAMAVIVWLQQAPIDSQEGVRGGDRPATIDAIQRGRYVVVRVGVNWELESAVDVRVPQN